MPHFLIIMPILYFLSMIPFKIFKFRKKEKLNNLNFNINFFYDNILNLSFIFKRLYIVNKNDFYYVQL